MTTLYLNVNCQERATQNRAGIAPIARRWLGYMLRRTDGATKQSLLAKRA